MVLRCIWTARMRARVSAFSKHLVHSSRSVGDLTAGSMVEGLFLDPQWQKLVAVPPCLGAWPDLALLFCAIFQGKFATYRSSGISLKVL